MPPVIPPAVVRSRGSDAVHGALLIGWQALFTAGSIGLSLQDHVGLWLLGQALLGLNMMQWFIIQHDIGHRALFRSPAVSVVLGHLTSLFCLLPYFPWQRVHNAHHKWTGWRTRDPTIPDKTWEDLKPHEVAIIDFCWKYWIPMFAFTFNAQTFFNIRRLNRLFPESESRRRHLFSILFIVAAFVVMVAVFQGAFFKVWLLAFFVFISISDPYLLSQHTHIDYLDGKDITPTPVPFLEQHVFSRTVSYPRLVERYVLYNSNHHGLHHRYPTVPCFRLYAHPNHPDNAVTWRSWLKAAKALPARDLIFHSTRHTGVRL
jgi:omega-6 fatty acid desaturase (delta-12 desaturase)